MMIIVVTIPRTKNGRAMFRRVRSNDSPYCSQVAYPRPGEFARNPESFLATTLNAK